MNIHDRRAAACAALEQKLQSTTSPRDRFPLLIELAGEPDPRNPEGSRRSACEALEIARGLDDQNRIAHSLCALGKTFVWSGEYTPALRHLQSASEAFERQGEPMMRMEVMLLIAGVRLLTGDLDEAIRLMIPCRRFFEEKRDPARTILAFGYLGDYYRTVGDLAEMLRHYRRAMTIAVASERQPDIAALYLRLAEGYGQMGYRSIERRYLFRGLAVLRQSGPIPDLARGTACMAAHYIDTGHYRRAEKFARYAVRLWRMCGNAAGEGAAWGMLGTIRRNEGPAKAALGYFRKGLRLVRAGENPLACGLLSRELGTLRIDMKEHEQGLALLQEGLAKIERSGQFFHLFAIHEKLAYAYEQAGEYTGALYHFKEFSRLKDDYHGGRKTLEASRLEMQRRLRNVTKLLEKKRNRNRTLSHRVAQKEAELVALTRKLMHEQRNGRNGTAASVGGASSGKGMLPENWEIFTRRFHKVHHGFYPQLVGRYPNLTVTEVKVCSLIRIGLASKEIAEILCVSKRTVDNHRARVHKKMQLPQGTSLTGFIAQI